MDIALPQLPTDPGELLAFSAAAFTAILGLFMMVAPGTTYRLLGIGSMEDRPGAIAEGRSSLGGFYAGIGIAAILFAQDFTYIALGLGFAFAAFGRILSLMSDRGRNPANYPLLVVQLVLAGLPLGYVFGFL